MKATILLPLIFASTTCCGQFAIVSDSDGYTNVRSTADINGKVADTLKNGHFVYCFETKGNWIHVNYTRKEKELDGYLYNNRLKQISDFEKLPVISENSAYSIYGKDSIRVTVSEKKFDKTKYRFSYYKDKDAHDYIQFINGKQYWGTDGETPTRAYKSIVIVCSQKKVSLPPSALENLFEPNILDTEIHYDRQSDTLYIQSSNSDGAGAYDVIWKIEKGVYKERYIMYGF